jgi:hypothetical protein
MKGRKVWLILVVWILQLLAHTPLDHCWHHRVNLALEQELPHLDPHNPLVFHFHIAHLETIEKPSPFDDPRPQNHAHHPKRVRNRAGSALETPQFQKRACEPLVDQVPEMNSELNIHLRSRTIIWNFRFIHVTNFCGVLAFESILVGLWAQGYL